MREIEINEGIKYFTFLKGIFKASGDIQKEYNWLITDHVCYPKINIKKD